MAKLLNSFIYRVTKKKELVEKAKTSSSLVPKVSEDKVNVSKNVIVKKYTVLNYMAQIVYYNQ